MTADIMSGLEKIAQEHGHICFGLAVGYRASLLVIDKFEIDPLTKEDELVVVMQENSCCEDAVRMTTGCSWQNGTLVVQQCGRAVFIFYNNTVGKAIRLTLKDELVGSWQEIHELKNKIFKKTASKKEKEYFKEMNQCLVKMITIAQNEDLFDIEHFNMTLLVKLSYYDSLCIPVNSANSNASQSA